MGCELGQGLSGIDDDGRQAMAIEGDGEGEPDKAAAEDDDVRAFH